MKTSRAFSPKVSEALETRDVPSTLSLVGAHKVTPVIHAVTPVIHPAGTLSIGSTPGVITSGGSKIAVKAAPAVAVAITPKAVTPPVTHPAGTLSIGSNPGVVSMGSFKIAIR